MVQIKIDHERLPVDFAPGDVNLVAVAAEPRRRGADEHWRRTEEQWELGEEHGLEQRRSPDTEEMTPPSK